MPDYKTICKEEKNNKKNASEYTTRSPKKILITGSTGFLGSAVLKQLLNKEYELICISRQTGLKAFSNVSYYSPDFNNQNLNNRIKDACACIHLAAETRSPRYKDNYATNVVFTKKVLSLCKSRNIRKIIYTSSINTRFKRPGSYGKTKLEAEEMIKQSGLDYIIFLPPTIFGDNDRSLSKIIFLIKKLPFVPVIGNGRALMQPVYVEDAAKTIINSIDSAAVNKTYYLGGKDIFSFDQLVKKIQDKYNLRKKIIHIPFAPIYFFSLLFSFLYKKFPITPEQCISLNNDKNGDIGPARKLLSYNPVDFDAIFEKLYN
jgi:NADH dehydrogenase